MDIASLTGPSPSPARRRPAPSNPSPSPSLSSRGGSMPPTTPFPRLPPIRCPDSPVSPRSPLQDHEWDRDKAEDRYEDESEEETRSPRDIDPDYARGTSSTPMQSSSSEGAVSSPRTRCEFVMSDAIAYAPPASTSTSCNDTRPMSVMEIAKSWPGSSGIIPQRPYCPPRGYRMRDVLSHRPIVFFMSRPKRCGISCKDALLMIVTNLEDRDMPVFEDCGPAVSLRLMWPGYPQWSRQIPTRDFRSTPKPITLARLAKNVARTVELFVKDMNTRLMTNDADRRWRIGDQGGITFDDLELLGLQHVSMGSWQVHLRVKGRP